MATFDVKYPDVTVQLSGESGNVFSVIGAVASGIKRKHGNEAAQNFKREALNSESYDDVLVLCMRTVNVE